MTHRLTLAFAALRTGATLYKSSLFAMQLDLLLPTIRPLSPASHPQPPVLSSLLSSLKSLRTTLLALPALPPTTPRLTLSQFPNIPYPASGPADDAKWLMTFLPPKEAQIVGDWALGTCSSSKAKGKRSGKEGAVELSLRMDDAMFQEKDFMNGRFFFKRTYWLAVLAAALTKSAGELGLGSVEWSIESGSEWKPILVLRSKPGGSLSHLDLHPSIFR